MGWQPLPADAPLDHEALPPPPFTPPDQGSGNFAPLPENAQLDQPQLIERPQADDAPVIIAAVRSGAKPPVKSEEITPTYTEAGFDGEIHPDKVYHSGLSPADKQEYAQFFKDPKKPPSAAALGLWYHQKTGAYLANAQDIVDTFKKSGKFSTAEKISLPTKSRGAAGSFSQHTANALLGDFGAEITAPLGALGLGTEDRPDIFNSDASFGDLVGLNADITNAQLDRNTDEHPIASGAGELTGIAAATPLLSLAGDAAGLAKLAKNSGEFNRTLIQGGTEGAIYGAGAAGPGHRLEGVGVGAATVPAVAGLTKLPLAAANAGRTVLEGSPGLAKRIIAKAIKDDANTPESAGKAITEAQANGVPMALGDTGENVRGLMAASSRSSGVGRTIVRDALETRQGALADRITQHIERDLGPVANPHQVADDLMTTARTDAAPLYEKAYARPGASVFARKIGSLLQRPSMKKAFAKAARIADEEGRDPTTLGFKVDPQTGETTLERVPSWQTLDYVKRGMDDVIEGYRDSVTGRLNLDTEGRAINNTQRSFLKAFDDANPDYAAARAAWAGPVGGINAMNLGRKALNMTADDLEARMRDMTTFEKTMAAAGARRAMAELVQSKGDTADIVHALVGTGKKRAMLARLFGDRKQFQRFVETLGQEKEGWRSFKQALLGSPTAANVADDATLEAAAMTADFAAGGMPVATATAKAVKFLRFKLGEKAKQQIAALLSDTNPAAIRELAAELRAQAEKRGVRIRRVNTTANAVGKGALVLEGQQAQ